MRRIFIGRAGSMLGPMLFFLLLTIAFTWPLGNLAEPVLPDHNDAYFSVWRLAWVAWQLTIEPSALFDANIFWPERNTLAYSDAMLLLGFLGAPLIWLGMHQAVVHNVLLLAAFVTAGLGAARLVRHFTESAAAQLVAGVIFAFAPYRIAHIGHLELLWTAFLPLALLSVYRVLERPTLARGVALGVTVGLQALCSIYYFVFLSIWLVPAMLLAAWHARVRWSRPHLLALSASALTAAILIAPYVGPYTTARESLPDRSGTEIRRYSAVWSDYLRPANESEIYPTFPSEAPEERTLFVGITAMSLATMMVVLVRTRAAAVFAILGVIAFDLSLGVNGLGYNVLLAVVPPLGGFRAPARFGVFVLLAVAVLAGLATGQLLANASPTRRRIAAASILVALSVEYLSAPLTERRSVLIAPEVYRWLSTQPATVVLELPVPTPNALWLRETTYQYFSTFHWQRLANGYSGYAPASYIAMLEVMRGFPSSESMRFLREREVDLVVLHEAFLGSRTFSAYFEYCKSSDQFDEVRSFGGIGGRAIVCRIAAADR